MTSGTLNRLLQPNVFKGFLIFVILSVTLMMGCDKEEPCSGDEPFVEPAWVKEIQTEIENDPFICSANLELYELLDRYFIFKRVLVDTTWNVFYTLYDYDGNIINNIGTLYLKEVDRFWEYFNPSCSWKSGVNLNCGQLESDSLKILLGRWKLTAILSESWGGGDTKYYAGGGKVLEFKPTGEMVLETYSNFYKMPVKNEGYYTLDSLLRFNFTDVELPVNYPLEWMYEFSYCNNSLRITAPYLNGKVNIYVRQK